MRWGPWLALAGVLALAAALRFYGLGRQSIWWDEAYSLDWGSHDIPWIVHTLESLNHPPLFFALLHAWMLAFGQGVVAARSFDALIGVAGVAASYLLGSSLFRRSVGLVFALFVAVSEFHVYYSQEVRNYAPLYALAVVSMHAYWRLWHGPGSRRWNAAYYVAVTAALLYTHYVAVFVVAAQFLHRAAVLVLAPERRSRPDTLLWGATQATLALLFLPWALVDLRFAHSFTGNFWVPSPTFGLAGSPDYSIVGTFYQFAGPPAEAWVLWILVANAFLAVRLGGLNRTPNPDDSEYVPYPAERMLLLLAWGLCSVFLPFFQSLVSQPMYLARVVTPALAPFLLLAAVGVMRMSNPVLKLVVVGLVVGLTVPTLGEYYTTDAKEDWKDAAADLQAQALPNATVLVVTWMTGLNVFNVYQQRPDLDVVLLGGTGPADVANARNATVASHDVWLLASPSHGGDPTSIALAMGQGRHVTGEAPKVYMPKGLPAFPAASNPVYLYHWTG